MADVSIYWFRDDLRLSDLPGLQAAAGRGAVIPVYGLDEQLGEHWRIGSASRWWLHTSLTALQDGLSAQGSELILRMAIQPARWPRLPRKLAPPQFTQSPLPTVVRDPERSVKAAGAERRRP